MISHQDIIGKPESSWAERSGNGGKEKRKAQRDARQTRMFAKRTVVKCYRSSKFDAEESAILEREEGERH